MENRAAVLHIIDDLSSQLAEIRRLFVAEQDMSAKHAISELVAGVGGLCKASDLIESNDDRDAA